MKVSEFHELRNDASKYIDINIEFARAHKLKPHLLAFEGVKVHNSCGCEIQAGGTYNRILKRLVLYFTLADGRQICRLCVRGQVHKNAGRTHKHDITSDEDVENNLPHAKPRPELEEKTPFEIWEDLCKRAKLQHYGTFHCPV